MFIGSWEQPSAVWSSFVLSIFFKMEIIVCFMMYLINNWWSDYDFRFELDMLLESVNATAKRVEELLDSMNAHTYKIESSFSIEDHLSGIVCF